MQLKRFSIWALAFALVGAVCAVSASAAVVDRAGPEYEGEYFIAYNAGTSYFDYLDSESGSMPVADTKAMYLTGYDARSSETSNDVRNDIIDVFTDEDGRTLYRMEPRNLDKLKPPAQTFALYNRSADGLPELGDERSFVTVDMNTNDSIRLPFILKYSGECCNIWLEKDDARSITDEMVSELGMEYDFYIHDRMEKAFGPVYDRNGDGKMAILLYDIQDSYSLDPDRGEFTGGFFNLADMLTDSYNCMDVLHIDTYPSISSSGSLDGVKSTIVHELQHLIECSAQMEADSGNPGEFVVTRDDLPTWLNEGLSMAAEHMFYGVQKSRIDYYNSRNYWINTPLMDWEWGNTLSHYTLSYLFVQYLRTQTKDFPGGGEELYKKLINSDIRGNRCVEVAMRSFYPTITNSDIFLNFYIALTLKEDSGFYGFAGEKDFQDIQICFQTYKNDSVCLGGGAAIVSHPGMGVYTVPSDASDHIRFAAFRPTAEGEVLPVEPPAADEESGEVYRHQMIRLYSREPLSTIYYTLDGTEPTPETGAVYTGKPISLLSNTELRAITVAADGRQSEVASYSYTLAVEDFEFYRRTVGNRNELEGVSSTGAVASPDGGYIQVGYVNRKNIGFGDFCEIENYSSGTGYIIKYAPTGEQERLKTLDASIYSVAATDDGFVVAGGVHWGDKESRNNPDAREFANAITPWDETPEELEKATNSSAYLAKYDWEGNIQWISAIPFIQENPDSGYNIKYFNSVEPLRADSEAVCGYVAAGVMYDPEASGSNSESTFGFIARFDANGNLVWQNFLKGRKDNKGGEFDAVAVSHDGTRIVAVGKFYPFSFKKEDGRDWADFTGKTFWNIYPVPIAACYNAEDGSLLWNTAYDFDFRRDRDDGLLSDILPLEDGSFVVTGFDGHMTNSAPIYNIQIMRIDAEGGTVWRTTENTNTGFTPAVVLAEDGIMVVHTVDVILTGQRWLNAHGLSPISSPNRVMEFLAIKYDLAGNLLWTKNYASLYQQDAAGYFGCQVKDLVRLSNRKFLVCATQEMDYGSTSKIQDHGILFTFYDESVPHHILSGTIATAEGVPLPEVSVGYTLDSDPQKYAVLTDSQGRYSIKVAENSCVTLTPELEGYVFTSVVSGIDSETAGPVTETSSGHDFTAEIITYTVNGKVTGLDGQGLSGIQVGPRPEDLTGEDGTYSIQVRGGATLPLAPVSEESDVIFEPVRRVLPAIRENISNQDFRVLPPQYTVSGRVTREDGTGQGGVFVGDVLTAPDGTYSITVDSGTSLKLTPVFPQYAFSPAYCELEDILADTPDQDFVMLREDLVFRLEADPSPVEFEALTEGYAQPEAVTVTVRNAEGGPCVGAEAFLDESSPFIFTPLTRNTLEVGDGGATFTVRPRTGLAKGEYTAEVQIRQGETVYLTIPVAFTVKEKPTSQEPEKPTPQEPDKPNPPATPPSSSGGDTSRPAPKPEPEPVYLDHLPYMVGYPDGTFRTEANLTRGQCAAILARLSQDFDAEKTYSQNFSDVPDNRWYANSIGFLTAKKVIHGYPDGTFRPDASITRAEFVALLCNVLKPESPAENSFPDAAGHWAVYYIARLTQAGVLDGYPDGTFRPDAPITRSEAVKAVNRAYDRSETVAQFKSVESPFSDLENTYWAYYEILEASMEHRVQK